MKNLTASGETASLIDWAEPRLSVDFNVHSESSCSFTLDGVG